MKGVYSPRLNSEISRKNMLLLALMLRKRAAAKFAHYYPGVGNAFIKAMNAKAKALGMTHTRFVDTNGAVDS